MSHRQYGNRYLVDLRILTFQMHWSPIRRWPAPSSKAGAYCPTGTLKP